jgi:hypothetical protein
MKSISKRRLPSLSVLAFQFCLLLLPCDWYLQDGRCTNVIEAFVVGPNRLVGPIRTRLIIPITSPITNPNHHSINIENIRESSSSSSSSLSATSSTTTTTTTTDDELNWNEYCDSNGFMSLSSFRRVPWIADLLVSHPEFLLETRMFNCDGHEKNEGTNQKRACCLSTFLQANEKGRKKELSKPRKRYT